MPTYQYRCTECGTDLEAVQKFSDPALTECPTCHGQLRKVFNAVGVVFKGSGFYRTDSRAKDGANGANGSTTSGETKVTDGSGNGSSTKESGSTSGSNGSGAAPKTEGAKTPAKAGTASSTGASSSS
jgi:putative FmdB family regulatory protein